MIKSFTQLTSCPLMNMNSVFRYSGTKLVEPESLSTHIVEVQMMGYMILNTLNKQFDEGLDAGLFLEKALNHDLEESLTGDVCRTLKYYNPQVLKELQLVAEQTATDIYIKYFGDEVILPRVWADAKKGKEGILVKIVDMLCVASKALKEVELLNNNFFLKVVYEVKNYLTDTVKLLENKDLGFKAESIEYLKILVEDAVGQLSNVWNARADIARRYKITDSTLMVSKDE